MIMNKSPLANFIFENSNEEFFMTGFRYDQVGKAVYATVVSFSGNQKRIATFKDVEHVQEETLEDFDDGTEWTIIGFDTTNIGQDRWEVSLQCLEKGFFFESGWPTLEIIHL